MTLPVRSLVVQATGSASGQGTVNAVGVAIPGFLLTSANKLAPLIRQSRKRMKMSQQQFADAAGVGRRFLSELENGKPSLEFDKVISCAVAAGIDIFAKPRTSL